MGHGMPGTDGNMRHMSWLGAWHHGRGCGTHHLTGDDTCHVWLLARVLTRVVDAYLGVFVEAVA